MQLGDLATPAVLVDRDRLLNNITTMQTAASAGGLHLRPHAKTHKSPRIAEWQLAAGAVGITVAKVGEAEMFVDAGVNDIRLAYPLPASTAPRVVALMDRARLSLCVDHLEVATRWSDAITAAGRRLDVLVKVDVGFHRCGINPASAQATEFITRVAQLPGLRFRGLLSHAGQSYHAPTTAEIARIAHSEAEILRNLATAVKEVGIGVAELSVGATPTARYSFDEPALTEARPGNYVFLDLTQVALGVADISSCALSVLATVISKPTDDRLILDAGSKTLSSDRARGVESPDGFGAICPTFRTQTPDDRLLIERLSEEHAVVRISDGGSRLEPGDRVRIIPNHACVVANLTDVLQLTEEDTVIEEIAVAAKGTNR